MYHTKRRIIIVHCTTIPSFLDIDLVASIRTNNRYSGYCAWRGVLETSSEHAQEVAETVKKAYPDLGKCLYFDIAEGTHAGLYELLKKRLNWLWYINQPEPQLKVLNFSSYF